MTPANRSAILLSLMAACLFSLPPTSVSADTIVLKNGRELTCIIKWRTSDRYVIRCFRPRACRIQEMKVWAEDVASVTDQMPDKDAELLESWRQQIAANCPQAREQESAQIERKKSERHLRQKRQTKPSKPVVPKSSSHRKGNSLSFEKIDAIFGTDSDKTESQQNKLWEKYKGKRVTWTGRLAQVNDPLFGSISVGFRHNPSTLAFDVLAYFPENAAPQLRDIQEGVSVTYSGTLDDWPGLTPVYSVTDAHIIKVH